MTKGGKCFFMQDVQRESPRSDAFEQRPDRSGRVSEWALGGGVLGGGQSNPGSVPGRSDSKCQDPRLPMLQGKKRSLCDWSKVINAGG